MPDQSPTPPLAHVEESRYADADLATLALACRFSILTGAPQGRDPILAAFHSEARQFMHGACALLASHLHETRGMSPIRIQGRPPGQPWMHRHVMACRCPETEALALIASGRGFDVPVLDAAGGGTLGERLPLYREEGWDYRAILARDPDCASHWMWLPNPARPASDLEGTLPGLPALAQELGLPFDLRDAIAGILDGMDDPTGFEACGLADWARRAAAAPT